MQAGFALSDPGERRHQTAYNQRLRLGRVLHSAAVALKQEHEGEDHIDAVMSVVKGIDTYLLDYALSRGDFDNLQKSYATARESVASYFFFFISEMTLTSLQTQSSME